MGKPTVRDLYQVRNTLPSKCAVLLAELMQAGLPQTTRAMHEVVRQIGWELAEQIELREKEAKNAQCV